MVATRNELSGKFRLGTPFPQENPPQIAPKDATAAEKILFKLGPSTRNETLHPFPDQISLEIDRIAGALGMKIGLAKSQGN